MGSISRYIEVMIKERQSTAEAGGWGSGGK